MIENNLKEISEGLQAIAPIDYIVDISFEGDHIIIRRSDDKLMKQSDITFFEESHKNIAKLLIEVKSLREVNAQLKRLLVKEVDKIGNSYESNTSVDGDLRFL
jgi:hypothetical protein